MPTSTNGMRKRRVTINDIAQMAHTSKTTVSFYLNGNTGRMSTATQERIKRAITQTGYVPNPLARGMNAKRTSLIGVVIGDMTNTFANRIVKGIASVADSNGYRLLASASGYDRDEEAAYIDRLLSVGVDGFIVQPTGQFRAISQAIEDSGKKLVLVDSHQYDYSTNWVKTDNYEATYRAMTQMVEKGYRRFLLIAAPPQLLSSRVERSSGFMDALETAGLDHASYEIEGRSVDVESVRAFLREHVDGTTPTLVFAPNCWALPDVYAAMQDLYPLMPDTVGLLGFDNYEWAGVAFPSVTTIEQPAIEEGRKACEVLLDLIEEKREEEPHQVLPCSIAWRGTTR